MESGPWSLRSTTPLLLPAGAYQAPGVIATALAAETPRRPSGGNHRNDAPHWFRGCSSCEDLYYGAHHWPWDNGAGHLGQERRYRSNRFVVTMVTSWRAFATRKIILSPGIHSSQIAFGRPYVDTRHNNRGFIFLEVTSFSKEMVVLGQ